MSSDQSLQKKPPYNFLDFANSLEPPKKVKEFTVKEPVRVQKLVLEPTYNRYTTQVSCKDYQETNVPPVWMKAAYCVSTRKENWVGSFSFEIKAFVNFIKPFRSETKKRNLVLKKYKDLIEKSYPDRNVEVCVFGSFATKMFLPTADLDIVVIDPEFDKENSPEKGKMASKLSKIMKKVYPITSACHLVRRAKVPVLNVTDKNTDIHIDITFNNKASSVNVVNVGLAFKSQLPHLESLVYVLKLFLSVRELNKPMNGGIGGYGIILWVAGFLRMHNLIYSSEIPGPTKKPAYVDLSKIENNKFDCPNDVALYFMHFLHFFGYCFDFEKVGIAPGGIPGSPDTIFFQRKLFPKMNSQSRDSICLMDPMKSDNNVTGGCSQTQTIVEHFRSAYTKLGETINGTKPNSNNWFLSSVLRFDSELGKQRLSAYLSKFNLNQKPDNQKPEASAPISKKNKSKKRSREMMNNDGNYASNSRSNQTYASAPYANKNDSRGSSRERMYDDYCSPKISDPRSSEANRPDFWLDYGLEDYEI